MVRKAFITLLFLILCLSVRAQYYVTGADPVNYRWRQIKREGKSTIIYPDFVEREAFIIANISDIIRPYISYGLNDLQLKFPIVMHPSTIFSNGMVAWVPRRMELMTHQPVGSFATPWLEQLVVHETRHVVQLSSLSQGFTKGAGYVIGEQAEGIVSIVLPKYFYEGDAVAAETQMAMYGRGLQPSFTIAYRAMMNEDTKRLNLSRMKLGSHTDYIPSAYQFGYHITEFSRQYYGHDFWENVLNYVGRRSYTIFSYYFGFNKYSGGVTSNQTIKRAFGDLKEFWHEQSQVPNSATLIPNDNRFYTAYSNPICLQEKLILSLKESMQEPPKYVVVDPHTGKDKDFKYIGYETSRPAISGERVLWTEYKPSFVWGQKDRSQIRYLDINRRPRTKPYSSFTTGVNNLWGDLYYVTPVEEGYAMIAFEEKNGVSLLVTDTNFNQLRRMPFPDRYMTFNGLAWDEQTSTLAAIAMDGRGMYLASVSLEDASVRDLTPPSYVTRNNLTAARGKLYFNSIASGKDEAHVFDIESGVERRITTSQYGSVSPTSVNDSTLLLTTYTRKGYMLSRQKMEVDSMEVVEQTLLPRNTVSYPFRAWDVPKIDTMDISRTNVQHLVSKKYGKAAHMFNIHSWMPFYLNVNKLLNERNISIGWGATVLSQDMLNTMIATAGAGYTGKYGIANVSFDYRELPVNFLANFDYGGGRQLIYTDGIDKSNLKYYLSPSISANLPVNFSGGNMNRYLNTSLGYIYNNGLFIYQGNMHEGVHRMTASIGFESYARMASNDLSPRFGYFGSLSTAFNPVQSYFGEVLAAQFGLFLPGIWLNNSITLKAAYQYQAQGGLNYLSSVLFPRGVELPGVMRHQSAAKISYMAPLFYPDWEVLWRTFYITRLYVDLFGDVAWYRMMSDGSTAWPYAYGGTLYVDFNFINITTNITMGLSLYTNSDANKLLFSFALNAAF